MNRNMIRLLALCLILMLSVKSVSAQDAPVDGAALLKTADAEIFIKSGFSQDYHEAQGCVNEFIGDDVLHQYWINNGEGTDLLTSLQPAAGNTRATNKRIKFDDKRAAEFHMHYEFCRSESIPEGAGQCWIRYSNAAIMGEAASNGVYIIPGDAIYSFAHDADKNEVTEKLADLSWVNQSKKVAVDVIRLNGTAYFYINKEFLFEYEDLITVPVSFDGGNDLFEGGNRIRCDFDNFSFIAK